MKTIFTFSIIHFCVQAFRFWRSILVYLGISFDIRVWRALISAPRRIFLSKIHKKIVFGKNHDFTVLEMYISCGCSKGFTQFQLT